MSASLPLLDVISVQNKLVVIRSQMLTPVLGDMLTSGDENFRKARVRPLRPEVKETSSFERSPISTNRTC